MVWEMQDVMTEGTMKFLITESCDKQAEDVWRVIQYFQTESQIVQINIKAIELSL